MNNLTIKKQYFGIIFCVFFQITCNNDYSKELSGNYFYISESKFNKSILSHTDNKNSIYPTIISYAYNTNFIIAIQKPDYKQYVQMISFELQNDSIDIIGKEFEKFEKSNVLADSILKNNEVYRKHFIHEFNYWIIDHKQNKLFGPLSKDEYIIKRNELGIPLSLKL